MMEHQHTAPISVNRLYKLRLIIPILLLFSLLALDWNRSPKDQLSTYFTIILIDKYKLNISKRISFIKCTFEENCSNFGKKAFIEKGFVGGFAETFRRINNCF